MRFYSSRSSSSCCQCTLNLTSCSGRLKRTRSFAYFPNGIVCFIYSIQDTEPAQCVAALTLFNRLSVSQLPYNVKYTFKSYKNDDMFTLFFLSLHFNVKVTNLWVIHSLELMKSMPAPSAKVLFHCVISPWSFIYWTLVWFKTPYTYISFCFVCSNSQQF